MPGFGPQGVHGEEGVLPWWWAEQRLASSHDYWLATISRPDGSSHPMPV